MHALCRGGERSVSQLHARLSEITIGAVSQHLRVLREAGLVECRADGRLRLYRARPEQVDRVIEYLGRMWDDSLERLRHLAAPGGITR